MGCACAVVRFIVCKGWKRREQAKTASDEGVLSQTTSGRLSKTQAVTAIAVNSVYLTLRLLGVSTTECIWSWENSV